MRIWAQTEAYERHAGRNSSGLDRHAGRNSTLWSSVKTKIFGRNPSCSYVKLVVTLTFIFLDSKMED
jgi:hypothetical protein